MILSTKKEVVMLNNIVFYFNLLVFIFGSIFLFFLIIRYGFLRLYYRYFDKRPFEIKINGFNYIINPKSKEFIVDQMKRQREQNKKENNNENL